MAKSQLHFLGHIVDLLTVETIYTKDFNKYKGVPIFYNKGGLLKFVFDFEANFRFLERMKTVNYELYKRGYPIDDGKIVFYDANGDNLKDWYFKDAPVVYYEFKFDANGGGMRVEMIISPAIQNYGSKIHRSWHITPIEEEIYKSPVQATKPKTILVTKVIGPEELKLNEEGTYRVTSYNQAPSEQEKQRIKWMLKIGDKETQLKQQGEEIKYTVKDSKQQGKEILLMPYLKKHTETVSIKTKIVKEVLVIYIGGASDKESYYGSPATEIVKRQIKKEFSKIINNEKLKRPYESVYLGYNEVRGDHDIQNNVISKITNKENTAIYIIGHSLGGWNGAHLSQILTDKGYNVDLLITLDPVGVGSAVTYISDIFWGVPKPKANYWIQISTYPKDYQADDLIADLGEQWRPKTGMQINDECSCNHGSAGYMFRKNLKNTNISASDMLLHYIKLFLSKK
ncbi:type VI secretion system tube protein TssD [Tenacibaculum ovolyticum]|uniref:type VI secretion system tube protein TssD n=1 Tax=Tenacibaculum ovolyticum TaxID=104270 RepID=UPI0009ED1564|nr:type VI secretion system tube protein TssD [Tenacibaculum ovolyticum]